MMMAYSLSLSLSGTIRRTSVQEGTDSANRNNNNRREQQNRQEDRK